MRVSWMSAGMGAFLGTFSHVFLDALMHSDMRPWAPFGDANGLLGLVPIGSLHLACVVLGAIGALLYLARQKLASGSRSYAD